MKAEKSKPPRAGRPLSGHSEGANSDAMRDATGRIFAWLRQVSRDRDLGKLAYRVAFEISQAPDRKRGHDYGVVTHASLSRDLGPSRSNIQVAVAQLRDRGHLHVEPSKGKGTANRYRIRLLTAEEMERAVAEKAAPPAADEQNEPAPLLVEEPVASAVDRETESLFRRLLEIYPTPDWGAPNLETALELYREQLDAGVDFLEIHRGAEAYAAAIAARPGGEPKPPFKVAPLAMWLGRKQWKAAPPSLAAVG